MKRNNSTYPWCTDSYFLVRRNVKYFHWINHHMHDIFLGKLSRKIILKRSKICDINKYRGVCIITNNSPWNVSPSHFLSFQHFLFYRDLGSLISLKEKVLVHHRLHGLFLLLRRSHLNRTRNLYFNFNSIRPFVSHNLLRFFRLVAFA